MRKIKICIVFLAFGWGGVYAQETVLVSGKDAIGKGGTVSYSVGQVAYTSDTGKNSSANQGMQQPFEILVLSSTKEPTIQLEFAMYPNPTTNYVTLNVKENSYYSDKNKHWKKSKLSYQLFTLQGLLIEHKFLTHTSIIIEMGRHPPSIYILKIMNGHEELKAFKIVKN